MINFGLDRHLKENRRYYIFVCFLAVLIFGVYPEIILGTKTFAFRDFGLFGYAMAHYHRGSCLTGSLPFWNPYNNCGIPFLAQWNTITLYPFSVFYLLFPIPWSLNVFCLSHMLLGGLGMYRLAERWTQTEFGAFTAGVAYASNGLILSAVMWPNNMASLGWAPWVVLTFEDAVRHSGRRRILIAAGIAGIQMLAGAPEIASFTWIISSAVSCVLPWRQRRQIIVLMGRVAIIICLTLALSAIQLIPFLDLLMHSDRNTSFSAKEWTVPLWGILNFFVPLFRVSTDADVTFIANQSWVSSFYCGIAVTVLALLAAVSCKESRAVVLSGIAVLGLFLSFGDKAGVFSIFQVVCPLINLMRFPVKFVVLVVFCIPLLAAYGVKELSSGAPRSENLLGACACALFFMIQAILLAKSQPVTSEDFSLTMSSGVSRGLFLLTMLGILWACRKVRRKLIVWALHVAFVILLWLDLISHQPLPNPAIERSAFANINSQLQPKFGYPTLGTDRASCPSNMLYELNLLEKTYRLAEVTVPGPLSTQAKQQILLRRTLFSNYNLTDRVPVTSGFYSLFLFHEAMMRRTAAANGNAEDLPLCRFQGVSLVLSDIDGIEWEYKADGYRHITGGQKPVFLEDGAALAAITSMSFDPLHIAYFHSSDRSRIEATGGSDCSISSPVFGEQNVSFDVNATTPSIVIVAQAYYHNWKAHINGKPSQLFRANYAFQGIQVPAGFSRVNLTYRERGFYLGAMISAVTLFGCALIWATSSRMKI